MARKIPIGKPVEQSRPHTAALSSSPRIKIFLILGFLCGKLLTDLWQAAHTPDSSLALACFRWIGTRAVTLFASREFSNV